MAKNIEQKIKDIIVAFCNEDSHDKKLFNDAIKKIMVLIEEVDNDAWDAGESAGYMVGYDCGAHADE